VWWRWLYRIASGKGNAPQLWPHGRRLGQFVDGYAHALTVQTRQRTGHRSVVPESVPFEEGDIRDSAFLDRVFKTHQPDAVMVRHGHGRV
jgi:UDP-glucose 4-epimerase